MFSGQNELVQIFHNMYNIRNKKFPRSSDEVKSNLKIVLINPISNELVGSVGRASNFGS